MTTKRVVAKTEIPTDGQGKLFVKMAREKRVLRPCLQTAFDDGTLGRVLDGIKAGVPITIGTSLTPPFGCRLHILEEVPVVRDRDWREAIKVVGSNAPDHSGVYWVGSQYPPESGRAEKEEIILLNFPSGGSWEKAISWAEQFGLERTDPREVFAIGEHKSKFYEELRVNPGCVVVATKECPLAGLWNACCVRWGVSWREAYLCWVENLDNSRVWFAFRRPAHNA